MGPAIRCAGPYVPTVQVFQHSLPAAPQNLANFVDVSNSIRAAMKSQNQQNILQPDLKNGQTNYAGMFVLLAWQCASTFRHTDYLGGCNGARIRFSPQINWPVNIALDKTLQLLQPVKDQYGASLSYADLIVLAGKKGLVEIYGGGGC